MEIVRRWKTRGRKFFASFSRTSAEELFPRGNARIYLESIQFSGGQEIKLNESSILVIVGPNNAGKSSVLREIRDHLQSNEPFGPVLQQGKVGVTGSVEAFRKQFKEVGLPTDNEGVIRIDRDEYSLLNIEKDIKTGFVGSKAMPLLLSYLGAEQRLQIANPADRSMYRSPSSRNLMQWLELDDDAERRISGIFRRAFDVGLVLNTIGHDLVLHVVKKDDAQHDAKNTREEAAWLASLPTLHKQGDGMRSFAGTILSLLVFPTTTILLDEPDAFLHPPQARRLAQVLTTEVPGECQVIVATHNDAFVRALLDATGNRLILARITREETINKVSILNQSQLERMWNDPLIRTSDVLSALFHDAAILCEGDSDARFLSALLDATRGEDRDSDVRLFHFGGKDRIANIARALRSVQIPVVAIVDIDILSDSEKLIVLFEAMGGQRIAIERDVHDLIRLVTQRKGQMTGNELGIELYRLAKEAEKTKEIPKQMRIKLIELGKASSNWQRVKQDGFRALDVQIFTRVSEACQRVGLLINPEGELEGFCRTIPRTHKGEWLAEVIRKDLASDPSLADARNFAKMIRSVTRSVISGRTR